MILPTRSKVSTLSFKTCFYFFWSLGLMFGLALLSSLLKALDEYARYKAAVINESLRR